MSQTRTQSIIETIVSTSIGYVFAILSQLLIFPWFDIHVAFHQNLMIGVYFTIISLIRQYAVRRFFNSDKFVVLQEKLNDILCKTWAKVYASHLDKNERVIKVLNWRSARVKSPGRVRCLTICFWIFD